MMDYNELTDEEFEEMMNDTSIDDAISKIIELKPPYIMMGFIERNDLGYYCDGVHPEWVWNKEGLKKQRPELIYKLAFEISQYWANLEEDIKRRCEKILNAINVEWYHIDENLTNEEIFNIIDTRMVINKQLKGGTSV